MTEAKSSEVGTTSASAGTDTAVTSHDDDKESRSKEPASASTQAKETDATEAYHQQIPRKQHRQASRQLRRIATLMHTRTVFRFLLRLLLGNQKLWKLAPQHLVSLLGMVPQRLAQTRTLVVRQSLK